MTNTIYPTMVCQYDLFITKTMVGQTPLILAFWVYFNFKVKLTTSPTVVYLVRCGEIPPPSPHGKMTKKKKVIEREVAQGTELWEEISWERSSPLTARIHFRNHRCQYNIYYRYMQHGIRICLRHFLILTAWWLARI